MFHDVFTLRWLLLPLHFASSALPLTLHPAVQQVRGLSAKKSPKSQIFIKQKDGQQQLGEQTQVLLIVRQHALLPTPCSVESWWHPIGSGVYEFCKSQSDMKIT